MGKRSAERPVDTGEQAYLKRQKITHATTSISTEDIKSAQHLQQLLTFDQDVGRTRHGIQSFKVFLESFTEDEKKKSRLPILKEYLQSQVPQDENDKAAVYLNDIMQAWNFSAQSNNDSLLSAVPAVLALLLKTLSAILECVPYGLRLGRTVLQKRQLEFLVRGLTVNKTKDFIISPNLRLIREITIFDGGALAREVFRARNYTFKALGRNMGQRYHGFGVEDIRKPSVRTHALRLYLSCLKFLTGEAKKELVGLRDVVSALTRDMAADPPFVMREVLEALSVYILQDEKLPREAKRKFLGAIILGRFASLYGYDQEDYQNEEGKKSVNALAHEFLLLACTSPDLGVLNRQKGYYPRGVDPDEVNSQADSDYIDLGLQSLEWADKFTEEVPVCNTILAEFMQVLRPWSDMRQSELLLEIFKAAPELVADYFFRKKSFSFEPKDTPTWIGYSALIFSAVSLPVPAYFGHQDRYARLPPPSSIVIECILPLPCTQKILTRCLNLKAPLIRFFAIRLLVIAFQKLQDVLKRYREALVTGSPIWDQAASQLVEEFCRRCPVMKDVIIMFSNIPEDNLLHRQAASRLLVMYYEVIPQVALESKFDVSGPLTQVLSLLDAADKKSEGYTARVLEVENLFQIAYYSPGMRWFNKAGAMSVSPFTAILKLSVQSSTKLPMPKLTKILDSIITENGVMQFRTKHSAREALIVVLAELAFKVNVPEAIYDFLDNCLLRCSTTPVKYIDKVEEYQGAIYGEEPVGSELQKPISLLLLTILEQWSFMTKSDQLGDEKMEQVAKFIAEYVAASIKIGEDEKVIKEIANDLIGTTSEGSSIQRTLALYVRRVNEIILPELPVPPPNVRENVEGHDSESAQDIDTSQFDPPTPSEDEHAALTKWLSKEIFEVLEDGLASSLFSLLSSSHLSIRRDSLLALIKLNYKIHTSSHPEKEQMWLLISELLETARDPDTGIDSSPLPWITTAFASHAVAVLLDPLSPLYPKVNTFLTEGPKWDVDKLPLLHVILHESPTVDDAHYEEMKWLLGYLFDGLRGEREMEILRKRRVWEGLLSLMGNMWLVGKALELKEKILGLLWRATGIDGGSDTLVTRFSVLSWLSGQIAVVEDSEESGGIGEAKGGLHSPRGMKMLMERIILTCDGQRLHAWSGRTVEDFLADIQT